MGSANIGDWLNMGMDTKTQMFEQAQRRADDYWRQLGDVTVAEAHAMPYGGERNLAMRKALGIRWPSDTTCVVLDDGTIQVVHGKQRAAQVIATRLRSELQNSWDVRSFRRGDGRWMIQATADRGSVPIDRFSRP